MFDNMFNGDLPLQATEIATHWDNLYNFLLWVSVFSAIPVLGGMFYYAYKYKDRGQKPKYITGSHALEAVFITIPTVLLMIIFGWGWVVYRDMTQAPPDAMEIRVIGKQWVWQFQYDNGKVTTGEVYVPVNKPVKMVMTSQDVIHSFFVPNFRVKQDVVPGMYSSVWFEAKMPGRHKIFCAEYCGTAHSGMLGDVVVLTESQWKEFEAGKKIGPVPIAGHELGQADTVRTTAAAPEPLHVQGKSLFEAKGCVACHSTGEAQSGAASIGPNLKGLYGRKVELTDGTSTLADENYLRESIEKPNAKLVKGFSPVMPTFQGLIQETEMNALIAYIKSLK